MRIGVFGGSFDPVHVGHLIAAECCREQARLDRVLFVPAAIPPHKQERRLASGHHRIDMLLLATGGHPAFAVSPDEIDRGGVSYTLDTLQRLAAAHPRDDLVLLLGPDAFLGLPGWHEPRRIASLAEIVPMERETLDDLGCAACREPLAPLLGADLLEQSLAARVRLPAIGIRSSDLRADVAGGRSIRYRTPRAVEMYIASHGLYR
ncbi:MAG: nicotinate (nicotinamide) nucleotide adenylyltransferase [Planctomycetia bacterium]|nr:nicotinate (nicotinamide) nucleotide adenylyltransferase [Planctomycetia bacterium]